MKILLSPAKSLDFKSNLPTKRISNICFEEEAKHLNSILKAKSPSELSELMNISSKIANNIRKFFLKDGCDDTGCSLKIFNKKVFLKLPEFNGLHRFLPALFRGFGYKTGFINVDHRYRKFGKSKYGTFFRLFRGINDLIKVYLIIKSIKKS